MIDEATRAEWRRQAIEGTLSTEDMRAWIELVRGARRGAAATSARAKARKAPPDVDSLLTDIDNL
jgi:hypothetical protein